MSTASSRPPPASPGGSLIDTREWPIRGPSVRAVETPADLIGPGMRGRIQTPVGLWLPFQITRWEPEHVWAWRVAGIDATGHRVEPLGPSRCRVTFEIPRWAPLLSLGLRCGLAPDRGAGDIFTLWGVVLADTVVPHRT